MCLSANSFSFFIFKISGDIPKIHYYSPSGRLFQSIEEITNYNGEELNLADLSIHNFSFDPDLILVDA